MDSMFEILMGLPLMNGVSRARISEIVGKVKFHFLKYLPGEQIVNVGEACTHLKFVISGTARMSLTSDDGRLVVSQSLSAPSVIAPDYLFGRETVYPCSVTAVNTVGILQFSKADYLTILEMDRVFLFNYLNTLSSNSQKSARGLLVLSGGDLEARIAFWVISLTQSDGTDIKLTCRQRDLYSMFGVQRTSFISVMESMRERGLIEYDSHEIRILSRRALLESLSRPSVDA